RGTPAPDPSAPATTGLPPAVPAAKGHPGTTAPTSPQTVHGMTGPQPSSTPPPANRSLDAAGTTPPVQRRTSATRS
ncbi:hypothetical protein B5181_40090, partial [Streptomyces sp. 4F]